MEGELKDPSAEMVLSDSFEIINRMKQACKVGWLVGCFGLNGPLRQYFSLYRAISQREGERKEK